ncbi:hypothetical protein J6590_031459 [Homalodisca vitripennis]|nr:hypothetical protein J6590_031459 [Homalodisca vitripennis]
MYTHSFTTANVYPIGYTPDFSRVRRAPNGWVRRLSQDNQIKQCRAWLLLGWVTAERSCLCKRPGCWWWFGSHRVRKFVVVHSILRYVFVLHKLAACLEALTVETDDFTSGKAEKLLKILKKNLDRELVAKKKLEGEFLAEEGPDKFSHGLGMY